MLNIPLARKVIEHIESHPEEHDQSRFVAKTRCGTTACIAGHALLLSGEYDLHPMQVGDVDDFRRVDGTDDFVIASDAGQVVLGLTDHQRDVLFYNLQDENDALDYLRGLLAAATL